MTLAAAAVAVATVADRARLLIVGDDLSGTADCAVTCTHFGLDSVVALGADTDAALQAVDVLALDADTRGLPPGDAARLNAAAWQAHSDGRRLYKKIDSTLRGNVAAEIAALTGAGMAIVAPAFPAAGRTTVEGRQYVFDVPVEESEVWRNERIAGRADLVEMLRQAGMKVALLGLDTLHQGLQQVRHSIIACQVDGVQALVCDARTVQDLACIAEASAPLDGLYWVGSAGLATPLVRAWQAAVAVPRQAQAAGFSDQAAHAGGVLVIVGSMSSVSHAQAAALAEQAGAEILACSIDATSLLDPMSTRARELAQLAAQTLQQGCSVLVTVSQDQRAAVSDGARLARQLAEQLGPVAQHASALIATGGETARAMLIRMGVRQLGIVSEIDTGVPLMRARHLDRDFPVVTKAGGFGRPDTLYRAWRQLSARRAGAASAAPTSTGEEL